MFIKVLIITSIIFASAYAEAFSVKGDLIIVHPSRTWDPLATAKEEIQEAIATAKFAGNKIYLLRHSDQKIYPNYPTDIDSYYIQKDENIIEVASEGGENEIIPSLNEITITGGYLEFCLSNAMAYLIKNKSERLKINIYLPGVFTYDNDSGFRAPMLPEDFELASIWPYPVNPGFRKLERQVGRQLTCPNEYFIGNYMFSYGGDYPKLGGGPTPEHFNYTYSCNDQDVFEDSVGDGGENLVHFNFVTTPIY